MNHKPERSCMGCFDKKEKSELIRIVKNKNGEVFIDKTGKADGRGIYLCKDEKCLERLMKNNKLEKVLHIRIDQNLYDEIRGVIIDK